MTTTEFSNEFDVLYNNIASNAAPGINEYEKSIFLTRAQSEIVRSYFEPNNKVRTGFDGSEKRQYDFSILMRTASLFNINTVNERITPDEKIDKRSQVFIFPEDYFLSVNEVITDSSQFYSVLPITYDEYQRMMTKPYPYPPKRVAWRIISDKKNCNYIHTKFNTENNIDLKFLTTWADQKRTLTLFLMETHDTSITSNEECSNKSIQFQYSKFPVKVEMNGTWESETNYKCVFNIKGQFDVSGIDYETYFDIIKQAFKLYKEKYLTTHPEYEINTVMKKVDAFLNYEAPANVYLPVDSENSTMRHTTLHSQVIYLPIAEIIGAFRGDLTYQIRYVKRPKPIILEDLSKYASDLSIDGIDTITECELPTELHQEILQRAVELAKAAYIGDLSSTVGIGNLSSTNIGIIPSNTSK